MLVITSNLVIWRLLSRECVQCAHTHAKLNSFACQSATVDFDIHCILWERTTNCQREKNAEIVCFNNENSSKFIVTFKQSKKKKTLNFIEFAKAQTLPNITNISSFAFIVMARPKQSKKKRKSTKVSRFGYILWWNFTLFSLPFHFVWIISSKIFTNRVK